MRKAEIDVDFLVADYDNALETLEQQKKDILKLISMLIEMDITIPGGIIDRYIKRISDIDSDVSKNFRLTNCICNRVVVYSTTNKK